MVVGDLNLTFFKDSVDKIQFTQNNNGYKVSPTASDGSVVLNSLYSFLPTEFRFSHFAERVLTDDCDVSELRAFKKHVEPTSKILDYEKKLQKCETKTTKKPPSSPTEGEIDPAEEERNRVKTITAASASAAR